MHQNLNTITKYVTRRNFVELHTCKQTICLLLDALFKELPSPDNFTTGELEKFAWGTGTGGDQRALFSYSKSNSDMSGNLTRRPSETGLDTS